MHLYDSQEEAEQEETPIYEKYNRNLHGTRERSNQIYTQVLMFVCTCVCARMYVNRSMYT